MRTTPVLSSRDVFSDGWVTLESTPRIRIPARFGRHFRIRLTTNAALEPPEEGAPGQRILLRMEQDATGGWPVTPNAGSIPGPGFDTRGTMYLNLTANSVSLWEMLYDEDSGRWDLYGIPDLSTTYAPLVHGSRHLPGGADPVFGAAVDYAVSNDSSNRVLDVTALTNDEPSIRALANVVATMLRDFDARNIPGVA